MTFDEFRLEMASYRQSVHDEANSLKIPCIALERLCTLYGKFDANERKMADQVIGEWALSEDEEVRFDALALIHALKIDTAVPVLHELAARIASSLAPSASYELKKIQRILAGLRIAG